MRRVGGAEVQRHVLVDGNNLAHRAFFSYVESRLSSGQPLLCSADGYPTGIVYGSLMMLTSWLRDVGDATRVSIFFDGYSRRRKAMDPSYKANREAAADRGLKLAPSSHSLPAKRLASGHEVLSEVDALAHVLHLLGCDVYHHPEEEADDLIASYCRQNPGQIRIIMSSDKDFFQLLQDPRVVCYVPGSEGDRLFDAERATQYWTKFQKGKHPPVPPTHVRMFKAMCGDSSDNVVGIDRLRKKVVLPLCHLSSVDDVVATGLPGFSDEERRKFTEGLDRLRVNYSLVGMYDDIDLGPCVTSGRADFALAREVLSCDLSIQSVDTSCFRVGGNSPPPIPAGIPSESWLDDV